MVNSVVGLGLWVEGVMQITGTRYKNQFIKTVEKMAKLYSCDFESI